MTITIRLPKGSRSSDPTDAQGFGLPSSCGGYRRARSRNNRTAPPTSLAGTYSASTAVARRPQRQSKATSPAASCQASSCQASSLTPGADRLFDRDDRITAEQSNSSVRAGRALSPTCRSSPRRRSSCVSRWGTTRPSVVGSPVLEIDQRRRPTCLGSRASRQISRHAADFADASLVRWLNG